MTVTAGTVFDESRTSLRTFFEAGWQLVTSKSGVSALALAETLEVSYQVAWPMLHRYRVGDGAHGSGPALKRGGAR